MSEDIEAYTRIINSEETSEADKANAYFGRGNTYGSLDKYKEAIADYTEAIALNPDNVSTYYNRGNAHGSLSKCEEAIADYTKAIEIDPNNASAYYNRASTHNSLRQVQRSNSRLYQSNRAI